MLLKILLIFLQFPVLTYSYNFLVINPVYGFSHYKFLTQIANTLSKSGHNVTMLQYYHNYLSAADKMKKDDRIEIIKYFRDDFEMSEKLSRTRDFWDSRFLTNAFLGSSILPNIIFDITVNTTTQLLRDSKFLASLEERNFDAVITEPFDVTGLTISHLINAKTVIPVYASVRSAVEKTFGQPSKLGYVPGDGSSMPLYAGILDRINDIYNLYFADRMIYRTLDIQSNFHSKLLGKPVPNWSEILEKSAPLWFVNSNPYLDFAVPSTRNIITVGGFTIDLTKKIDTSLSEDYQRILNEKPSTVFVSFGSVAKSEEMPDSFKSGLIEMFKLLPEFTFIWKYENENDVELKSRLPPNVHINKWVPQPALLVDKRVKLFITHGGLGSTMEVAYSGKPALMVPLFGDQPHNAQMLSRHGGARVLDRFDLRNGQKLAETIKEMTTNPRYQQNAEYLANVLRNQPVDPKEILLKNVEFAVKFRDFRAQVPEISRVGFIAFYYLDAYAVIVLTLFAIVFGIFKIFQSLVLKFVKKSSVVKSKNE